MKKIIDLSTWDRRQQFELFRSYDNPFWSVTVIADCTRICRQAKNNGFPLSLGYHYASLKAANEIDAFRQRLENGIPVEYDMIHASMTITRPNDGTYGFGFVPYSDNFETFVTNGIAVINRIENSIELTSDYGVDIVYYTVLRGIVFTSLTLPYRLNNTIPLLSFSEIFTENDGSQKIAHSIQVHHSFVDGQHASHYFKLFQNYLDKT
jgi:chloramphenicol O-acetyltransferase type A